MAVCALPTYYLVRVTGLMLSSQVEWNYRRNWRDPTARVARRKFWVLVREIVLLRAMTGKPSGRLFRLHRADVPTKSANVPTDHHRKQSGGAAAPCPLQLR